MGRPFMPHQQLVADVYLEVQSEAAGDPEPGAWAYEDGGLTVQRRGGKTTIGTPLVVHRAHMIQRARMFMTAQTRDKARSRWMDVTDDILGSPLRDDVRRKVSNGHEELRWKVNGSTLVPFAPNEDGLHSETPDFVLIDELWAFDAEQARAIKAGYVPAFATNPGQALKMSTAGSSKSAWLNDMRRAGRRAVELGTRLGVCYFEWGLPDTIDGVPVEDLSDEDLVRACIDYHPAVCHMPGCPGPRNGKPCPHGYTIRPSRIHAAFVEMNDRAEFTRAYGNRTTEDTTALWQTIARDTWNRQTNPRPIPSDAPVALGFDVDPERRDAAVSAAFRDGDGRMWTEVLRRDLGTRWVAGYIAGVVERNAPLAVAVNNAGPARDVADELDRAGVALLRVKSWDYAAACTRHRDELDAGSWFHRGEPDLTAAASVVGLRTVGEGRAWARPDEPITTLVSSTLAGWAFDHAPEPEKPLPPFWMG